MPTDEVNKEPGYVSEGAGAQTLGDGDKQQNQDGVVDASVAERNSMEQTAGDVAADQDGLSAKHKIVGTVGTLSYTKFGLITMFIWMLWGGFVLSMMERLYPKILPITLKDVGANNATIALLVTTIPMILVFLFVPILAYRSDRTRSRFGRRIPFMVLATPFIVFFLVMIGYGPQIGTWLHRVFLSRYTNISLFTSIIGVVGVAAVAFQFFNLFVMAVYYYLFADVVPEKYMGRFTSLFRVFGATAVFIFDRFFFRYARSDTGLLYLGLGLLYLVGFTIMCFKVKEGQYPPVPKIADGPKLIAPIKIYVKECYSNSYYRWFYIGTALSAVSMICAQMFQFFFAEQNLGMHIADYGTIFSWLAVMTMVLSYPIGMLCDRFKPLRLYIVGLMLVTATSICSFFFIADRTDFIVWTVIRMVAYIIQSVATLPMMPQVLPKERYGQFASANAVIIALAGIVASYGGGLFIDWVGDYQYIYFWDALFTGTAVAAMIVVYRGWKRYGGDSDYVAPFEDIG
jgi:Na+/melibiose symporter-like transporter